ncbi:MAG: hypothetical protein GX616_00110 [Planctomycetes bacterium]|nr:hypothetical protein [Planctomycetota bacterium]
MRSRLVLLENSLLQIPIDAHERPVRLNLFADAAPVVGFRRLAGPASNGEVLVGRVVDGAGGDVVAVRRDYGTAMSIHLRDGRIFQVRPAADGTHVISEIETAGSEPDDEGRLQITADTDIVPAGSTTGYLCDDGSIIDIMVVYTPAARAMLGGVSQMENEILLGISQINVAFAYSGISTRVRLVHTAEVDYVESGDNGAILDQLKNPADGILDEVNAMRNAYGADLVSLWVQDYIAAGMAFTMRGLNLGFADWAFTVCRIWAAVPNMTFAHEVGHNLGCYHDHPSAGTRTGLFPYSYGYTEPGGAWQTIMSVAGRPRVPHFSNPDVLYIGQPTGVPIDQPLPANNALTINQSAFTAANFRTAYSAEPMPEVLYVDDDAAPGGDGRNWGTAINDLQRAICLATSAGGAVKEIWVAAGTYRPDRETGERGPSFCLISGVAYYGGFAGGETQRDQRDPAANVTILSGDLAQDDGPDFANNGENSFHVVTGTYVDDTAVLDGFTITAGNANGGFPFDAGGGMRNDHASPIISNCLFEGNAGTWGAAVEDYVDSNPRITGCTFLRNRAGLRGGALSNNDSNPVVRDCTFAENHGAEAVGVVFNVVGSVPVFIDCRFIGNTAVQWGGAMQNADQSQVNLINCRFLGNVAGTNGGAIDNYDSTLTLTNCLFSGNRASQSGGAIWTLGGSQANLYNCTFYKNSTGWNGGGLGNDYMSTASLNNCVFWENTDSGGFDETGQVWTEGGPVTFNHNCIQGWTGAMGGTGNTGQDPMFIDPAGPDAVPGTIDDNPKLSRGSSCINTGNDVAVPPDIFDLDGDGDTTELMPFDLAWQSRTVGDHVDMGAFEFQSPPGDFDLDGDVDQADFGRFQACLSGAGTIQSNPECLAALIDDDGDVDGDDTQLFLGCLSGPDIPVSPQCAG